jgi:hypothetical protein
MCFSTMIHPEVAMRVISSLKDTWTKGGGASMFNILCPRGHREVVLLYFNVYDHVFSC